MSNPNVAKPADRVSEVAAALESQIESGALTPGTRLPSERQISEQMGVSRSVVREALNRLESQGSVSIRHGSGTVVETPGPRPVAESLERLLRRTPGGVPALVEVRLTLEPAIAALAAERRSELNLLRLAESLDLLGRAGSSVDEYVAADLEFHIELARACGNNIFVAVLEPIQTLLSLSRAKTLSTVGTATALKDHAEILAAVKAKDPAAARKAMEDHLRHAADDLAKSGGPASDGSGSSWPVNTFARRPYGSSA